MRGENRLHDFDVTEHRGSEDVEPGAVLEQQLRDVAAAHVRCGAEGALPVAAAPIPGSVRDEKLRFERSTDGIEVAVSVSDERLHLRGIERCWSGAGHGARRLAFNPMASGYVGVLTCELHFPDAHSLKEKRHYLRSAKAQLQNRVGAAVAEVDHHDLWQRARITVACVAREHHELERLLDDAERWLRGQEWEVALASRFVVDPDD
jgi:uncharacterized protein